MNPKIKITKGGMTLLEMELEYFIMFDFYQRGIVPQLPIKVEIIDYTEPITIQKDEEEEIA